LSFPFLSRFFFFFSLFRSSCLWRVGARMRLWCPRVRWTKCSQTPSLPCSPTRFTHSPCWVNDNPLVTKKLVVGKGGL
jgi:hypothetical protein